MPRRPSIAYLIQSGAGFLLIFAGMMKLYGRSPSTYASADILLRSTTAAELFVGIWLVIGSAAVLSRTVALTLFAVFAGVSLRRMWIGDASCGCFGRLQVNPANTFILDVGVCASLVCFSGSSLWGNLTRTTLVAILVMIAGLLIPLSDVAMAADRSMLDKQSWIGKDFAYLNDLRIGNEIRQGHAIVVLFNGGCGACREHLPGLRSWARNLRTVDEQSRVAFVEVPPFIKSDMAPIDDPGLLVDKLDQGSPAIQVPLIVLLTDGRVQEVVSAESIHAWLQKQRRPFSSSAR